MVRVRFAPSPTGSLHIGGLRTALYNQLFALRNGGTFVLRIEDTDRTRLVEGGIENIIRTLAWAGVVPDEGPYLDGNGEVRERGGKGPYVQSARLAIYREHADKLLESGRAYRCFCSSESLEEMKKAMAEEGGSPMYDGRCSRLSPEEVEAKVAEDGSHVVRLRVPKGGATVFNDAVRGEVRFENAHVDDQVLMKSDGFPTYHLANVIDDHLMGITHVIRGEEWLPSTPKHVLL
jgi:nondiscriminating glutamyl-tRNA synthetase